MTAHKKASKSKVQPYMASRSTYQAKLNQYLRNNCTKAHKLYKMTCSHGRKPGTSCDTVVTLVTGQNDKGRRYANVG